MSVYSVEMLLVGIILLSAMTIAGIKIWITRRKTTEPQDLETVTDTERRND